MRARREWLLAIVLLNGCSGAHQTPATAAADPVITQLYAPEAIAVCESGKICYGVEKAKTVWISPPQQDLSAAVARCIEVTPAGKPTYPLTVEGGGGKRITREI